MVTMTEGQLTCIQHGVWNDDYCGPECARLTRLYYSDDDLTLVAVDENDEYAGADQDDAIEALPLRKRRNMETVHLPDFEEEEES